MRKEFVLGKKLLFLTAHPDDESFLATGTMLANHKAGGESYIICATLGEKGRSQLKKPVAAGKLKKIRKAELIAVSGALKVKKVFLLLLPDGGLHGKENILADRCFKIAKRLKPDFIVSFGPDGISRHLDHIAAGVAARRVAKKLRIPFLAFARPPKIARKEHLYVGLRKHGVYSTKTIYTKPDIKISADPVRKLKIIQLHKSQHMRGRPLSAMPDYALREILKAEYYVFE